MVNWKTMALAVSVVCLFAEQSSSFPMESYLPPSNVQNVEFSECHWGCVPGSDPCVPLWMCSSTSKKKPTPTSNPGSNPGTGGSTGPTKPVPPITSGAGANKGLAGGGTTILEKKTPLGGSTGPTVPPKPTQGNINR
jgi:hypothetical protein